MVAKALLLYNAKAGSTGNSKTLESVAGTLSAGIRELTLYKLDEPGEGERICRERGEQYDAVLILGGDGTVHECINGLAVLDNPPVVGVLPGGTCNDFARTLGLPPDPAEAAAVLLEEHIREIDLGMVNDRVFTNFCGVGLITETSENINPDLKGTLGKISYFISTLQTIRSAEPFRYMLTADGETMKGEAVMIYAANGRYLGTNQLPFAEDSMCDGLLDILVIREAGLPLLRELLTRKPHGEWTPKNDSIIYIQASRLELTVEGTRRADTDGEIYLETPLQLGILERKLKFLTAGTS
ncbi:YegS/Rv2252/BmrU family lipid kinase [Paenibacillus sp. JX-17]|uniref:YegS/Rv2252/BmrU family lipid kinase n=1 Tax=Paenibacillus lacisoli TaxID=3064525 RepID=A0ABT9CAX3_9BACL|nr:YegS/Rv2252/BmrU family lipid kinase [Paenibacillus sp. JX-17]MDO7906408.1 YegS/Rv2252/BmrU family lipid kinase [Paenibacillus sp. JX-17]